MPIFSPARDSFDTRNSVSQTSHGLDENLRAGRGKLLAQSMNVHCYYLRPIQRIDVPYPFQDLFLIKNPFRMA